MARQRKGEKGGKARYVGDLRGVFAGELFWLYGCGNGAHAQKERCGASTIHNTTHRKNILWNIYILLCLLTPSGQMLAVKKVQEVRMKHVHQEDRRG